MLGGEPEYLEPVEGRYANVPADASAGIYLEPATSPVGLGGEADYLEPVEGRYVNVPADVLPGMHHAPARFPAGLGGESSCVEQGEPGDPESARASGGNCVNSPNLGGDYSAIDSDPEYAEIDDIDSDPDYAEIDDIVRGRGNRATALLIGRLVSWGIVG